MMDKTIQSKIEKKIQDTISNKDDVKQLVQLFSGLENSKSFILGILVGRVYNSFYYQSKRILNREPTDEEFNEFLKLLQIKQSELESLW